VTGALCVMSGSGRFFVSANPFTRSASGLGTVTTGTTTATPQAGTPPYSYLWSISSGDPTVTATSPNGATTAFRRTGVLSGNSFSSVFICTVTDAAGNSAISNPVNVTITGL